MFNLIPVALAATEKDEEGALPTIFVNIFFGIVTIIIAFFVATLLKNWVEKIIRKRQGDQHAEMRILYGRIVFTTTFIIGVVIALTIMGAPLEWFSGGVGLGVAFALRGVFANFFAGIALLSNDKFNLGDFVMLNPNKDGSSDVAGTIVDIQSRATSLRGFDGGEITVPNTTMIESAVKCFTKNPIRRHIVEIGVGYQTDIKQATEVIIRTASANSEVQPEPAVSVLVKNVDESAVTLEVRFWTESAAKWWITKSEVTHEVFAALAEAGIDVPHPIRTLRVDKASSDILAGQPNLLKNLEKIEKSKEQVFKKAPIETPNSPAPSPARVENQNSASASAPINK